MDIILKENVEGLGYASDLVTVKPGFGRNFLIPTGKAILATESAKKVREEKLRQRAHKEAKLVEEAKGFATKLEAMAIKLALKLVKVERSLDLLTLFNWLKLSTH